MGCVYCFRGPAVWRDHCARCTGERCDRFRQLVIDIERLLPDHDPVGTFALDDVPRRVASALATRIPQRSADNDEACLGDTATD
jgi:hypothetical protein